MITRLSFQRNGRRISVVVLTPDRARRRRIARAMLAAGWTHARIAAGLRIRRERLDALLAEPRLFDPATLKEAARMVRRLLPA
jgi:D-alanyl-D-alanine carboxypeptidase